MTDATPRSYPQGVPSWVEARHPDPNAAAVFYGELFGWDLEERMPPGAPGSYRIATVGGRDVGAITTSEDPAAWTTYIAVDDADATAARVVDLGGSTGTATDAGPGGSAGRGVDCIDPRGAAFSLWQARERLRIAARQRTRWMGLQRPALPRARGGVRVLRGAVRLAGVRDGRGTERDDPAPRVR
ncbi:MULTISPECIES: VOC family protein [unclassified Curtobacterium]|uniref:VOC family protein n=1 Tax=unclassified Curtobacterium TaxID=257496 RepID=UPI003829C68E